MTRIFVTGMGVISAIGDSVPDNHSALMQGKCGIGSLDMFPSKYAGILPFGEIKISTNTFKQNLQATESGITRATLLALHAFKEAIKDAQLYEDTIASPGTALIGATTVGGMCLTDELYHDANKSEGGSEYLSSYDCASVAIYLQSRYNMQGIVNTINTACSSSANAIMYGARLIKNGRAKGAIVGGVDSLAKFTINGFNASISCRRTYALHSTGIAKALTWAKALHFLCLKKKKAFPGKKYTRN